MTYYFQHGNQVSVNPSDSMTVLESLPPAVYTVKAKPMSGELFLQTTNQFELPKKVYGDTLSRAARVINTFNDRPKSTGVLLTGEKGSGKTLLLKALSIELLKVGVSTILVNEPHCGPVFNELIGNIQQPAVVMFDEFEKIFDEEDQEKLLTLLDGTVETKKLFLFTVNKNNIDEHLNNRPGRMYYKFHYDGLTSDFIEEYALDNLKNKGSVASLKDVCDAFTTVNFDMLQAMIEEMNRYNEDAKSVLNYLNIDLANDSATYVVSMTVDGEPIDNTFYPMVVCGNPLLEEDGDTRIEVYTRGHSFMITDDDNTTRFTLKEKNLISVDAGGKMNFKFVLNETGDDSKAVPRGPRRSMPPEALVKNSKSKANQAKKEVIITLEKQKRKDLRALYF